MTLEVQSPKLAGVSECLAMIEVVMER